MILALALLLAQADAASRASNQPVEPFHITQHLSYVGASDVTSFAIATSEGLVVLDGGFVETAPQIEANLERLGYALRDVKVLLSSHAHFDHAGGLAELKKRTGARFYAMREEAPALERGGTKDFAFGDRLAFPPVHPDVLLRDGDVVRFGDVALTAHRTPGHTRGCTTWTARIDGKKVVFLCSLSAPGYELAHNAQYPEIASDFRRSFALWKSLPCDIFLGAHGSFFDLAEKRKRGPDSFVDPAGYRAFVAGGEQDFERALSRQKAVPSAAEKR